jgi:hypothetical protein
MAEHSYNPMPDKSAAQKEMTSDLSATTKRALIVGSGRRNGLDGLQ